MSNIKFGIRQNRRVARSDRLSSLSSKDRIRLLKAIESDEALPSVEFEDGRKVRLRLKEPQAEQVTK